MSDRSVSNDEPSVNVMAGFSLKVSVRVLFERNLNAESAEVTSAEGRSGQLSELSFLEIELRTKESVELIKRQKSAASLSV